jgi:hypothetical protein
MQLGGKTFAPHVWHLKGKLGANLPYLPRNPNRPSILCQFQENLALCSAVFL